MIGMMDHCLRMMALTRKWSKGCSSVGTQDCGLGAVWPSMKVTALPVRMGRSVMILSLLSTLGTLPFSYCPCAFVRILIVVMASASLGKRWNCWSSCWSGWRYALRSPPRITCSCGLEVRRADSYFLRLAIWGPFLSLPELRWALMSRMLSTSRKDVLPCQFIASFSSGLSTVSAEAILAKEARLTTMMVSWEGSVTQAKLLSCEAMNSSNSLEYSWMRRTSKSSLSRVACTLASLRFSSRKDWSQNLLSTCLQTCGSSLSSSWKSVFLKTQLSRAWKQMMSQMKAFSTWISSQICPLFSVSTLKAANHRYRNSSRVTKRVPDSQMPTLAWKEGAKRPRRTFCSTFPMFHLKGAPSANPQ